MPPRQQLCCPKGPLLAVCARRWGFSEVDCHRDLLQRDQKDLIERAVRLGNTTLTAARRQTATTYEAPAAVWRRACGFVGHLLCLTRSSPIGATTSWTYLADPLRLRTITRGLP